MNIDVDLQDRQVTGGRYKRQSSITLWLWK